MIVLVARELALTITSRAGRAYVPVLRRYLPRAHAILRPPLRELSVALVGEARMSQLHEQFMHVLGPTDVLTFPLEIDVRGRPVSGEIVVCVPVALREARLRNIPVAKEVLLYALHGMLHLCSFDDRTAKAFREMHRKEDQILTALGLGPVFGAAPSRQGRRASVRRGFGA
jgi:rRNA maturation RNase YbeY